MMLTQRTKRILIAGPLLLVSLILLVWSLGWLAWWPQRWAQQALAIRDDDIAWEWMQQAVRWAPPNSETEFLLARIERKRGHLDEFRQHLERAKSLGGDRDRLHREELLAQAQTGALEGILTDLHRLLIDHSDNGADICEAYANGLLVNGQLDEALDLIQQWRTAFPADPQPDNLLGRLAEFRYRWQEAEKFYRSALAKNPRHFTSAYGLGRVLIELNRWQEA